MQTRSMSPEQRKQFGRFSIAGFVVAGVLFGLGFILMLAGNSVLIAHDIALILMTAGAIALCFAAAFSSGEVPPAEKTRLRALSILGSVVVVMAATFIASNFRVGTFEIVLMLVAVGGAWGMYRLGEIMSAKFGSAGKSASAPDRDTHATGATAREASDSGEGGGSAA